MNPKQLDLATARQILDFTGRDASLKDLEQLQIKGAVALHNMIADPDIGMGYLADEVGMGKTYVALGVIALLRYFNPSLRVLYICPSKNVQEKWYDKERRTFIKKNVRLSHYRVRTLDGRSAAPATSRNNMRELLNATSSEYFADIFVRMSAFSLPLTDDEAQWQSKLDELRKLVPAVEIPPQDISKKTVKDQYALTMNYVLPTFDLIVIDEAHNFKHDFESSDRNRVLSTILGCREDNRHSRIKHALLLSATPYDRDIEHLRNQLRLVGHEHLLPSEIDNTDHTAIEAHLRRFMIRRLNVLKIAGKEKTRNMYRKEWRYEERLAKISLKTDEQKLITALVQRKVGDVLDKQGGNPSFQIGLLASFESFAETAQSGPVEFDGDTTERDSDDAADQHVIGAIRDSYLRAELGRTLPHPKMDIVTDSLAQELFHHGRKQIIFVRRVKSVKELKDKLDDHYTCWLAGKIRDGLSEHPDQRSMMDRIIEEYDSQSKQRDGDSLNEEFREGRSGETEDRQPPKNDNLFSWFFRGACPDHAERFLVTGDGKYTTPEAMRTGIAARNQSVAPLFEINWWRVLFSQESMSAADDDRTLDDLLNKHVDTIATRTKKYRLGDDPMDLFEAAQLAFLDWYAETHESGRGGVSCIREYLQPSSVPPDTAALSRLQLREALRTRTLFCAIRSVGLGEQLFPLLDRLLETLTPDKPLAPESLHTLDIHKHLISLCLRTGHGIVDLYLARIKLGPGNLTEQTRSEWMASLVGELERQCMRKAIPHRLGFSTFQELSCLASHLELIIRNNFPRAYDLGRKEIRQHLARSLNPLAPIIGATGETGHTRSAQARKFRMPGYPLALISTDVFQEGEDLHTFCDSVMHYGLASTPIGIEQKNGRVDRVNSLAQRRLCAMDENSIIADRDLIQVSFPFVSESIELLQVRALCRNLNKFILSLDRIGADQAIGSNKIPLKVEFDDRSQIEEQIRYRLASRYEAEVNECNPKLNREQFIQEQDAHMKRITCHLESLVKEHLGVRHALKAQENGQNLEWTVESPRTMRIALRSARAGKELLLTAHVADENDDAKICVDVVDHETLGQMMQRKSWHTFHRTYAVCTGARQYELHHDSELLVGDEHNTSRIEVDRFFERFKHAHDPTRCSKPESSKTRKYWRTLKNGNHQLNRVGTTVTGFDRYDCLELDFSFGEGFSLRSQRVRIFEAENRCIFLSRAALSEVARTLSVEQLVKLTWERNRHLDVVEFMLDDEFSLVGRAVHPLEYMNFQEFSYCAYTLAESTDRLEFLIRKQDVH